MWHNLCVSFYFSCVKIVQQEENTMSDDNSPVVDDQKKKRGRPAKAEKNTTKEPKKRGRPAAENKNSTPRSKSDNEDDAPSVPAKRGRGRPKGSHKKKVYKKL